MTAPKAACDVLVFGSGPAGCAAAIRAAQLGFSVALFARHAGGRTPACAGWSPRAVLDTVQSLGVDPKAVGTPFTGLTLASWDFAHQAPVADAALGGVILDVAGLRHALLDAARAAGVEFRDCADVNRVLLGEREVQVVTPRGPAHGGRMLLIADGAGSATADLAQTLPAMPLRSVQSAAAGWAAKSSAASMMVCFGGGLGLKLAIIARAPGATRVELLTRDRSAPPAAQLRALLASAAAKGVLDPPADVAPVETPCIAGAALDLDTHVGKRCLLIGGAGGFAASLSGEGLHPSLAAAVIAAECAAEAIKAPVAQDELIHFGPAWRGRLADYLRPPGTDLTLLMPMLFQNPQMAKRTARAILLGEAF